MQRIPLVPVDQNGIPAQPVVLSFAEAQESPCANCATSPCCSYVHLDTLQLDTLVDLDYILYLLNFDRIELGLHANGSWKVYYHYPCQFLDRRDFSCRVHNTSRQPSVCVNYNPYNCWYKRNLTQGDTQEFLRIDRRRMEFIRDRLTFDESRRIVDVPSWPTLLAGFADLPVPPIDQFADSEVVTDVWLSEDGTPRRTYAYDSEAVQNPCSTCHAYCCTTLIFPRPAPDNANKLDFYQYLLGFPDLEIGISGRTWSVIVRVRCHHLDGNRCAVYGKPERPLRCRYYDALSCTYRPRFGEPRPDQYLRIRLAQFPWLAECFQFDRNGHVVELPPMEVIREHLEARSRYASLAASRGEAGSEGIPVEGISVR